MTRARYGGSSSGHGSGGGAHVVAQLPLQLLQLGGDGEDALLAVHDIGAVGYYAPRPVFDLAGLVTPEVVPVIREHDALMRMMCERGARYLMVLPDQRPAPEDDPRLGGEPIFTTGAPYAPAAGGGNMAVYVLNWGEGCAPP